MTGTYLNRNLISKTGMPLSTKTAANEFSPYNQTPWLLPPRLLQLTLPRSFPLLYCLQMLLGSSCSGSCVTATSTGEMWLRLRGVSPASPGAVWQRSRAACPQPHNQNPSLLLSQSKPPHSGSILPYQDSQASGVFIHHQWRSWWEWHSPTRRALAVVCIAPVGPFCAVPLI